MDFKTIQTVDAERDLSGLGISIPSPRVAVISGLTAETPVTYRRFQGKKLPKIKSPLSVTSSRTVFNEVPEKLGWTGSFSSRQRPADNQAVMKDAIRETINKIRVSHSSKPTSSSMSRLQFKHIPNEIPAAPPVADSQTLDKARSLNHRHDDLRRGLRKFLTGKAGTEQLSDLQVAFESVSSLFTESSNWFTNEGKIEAVTNLLYLERLFAFGLKSTMSVIEAQGVTNKQQADTINSLCIKVEDTRLLENRFKEAEAALNKFQTKHKETSSMQLENERAWASEKAKLEGQVDLLSKRLDFMSRNENVESLSRELRETKTKLENVETNAKNSADQRNTLLYSIQHRLGVKKEKLRKLKEQISALESVQNSINFEIGNRDDRIKRVAEQRDEYMENLLMFKEDFWRYYAIKERFEKLNEQFVVLKAKYNQLELNILLGNTGLGSGNTNVNLDDPIFSMFTHNSAEPPPTVFSEEAIGEIFTSKTELRYKFEGVNLSLYQYKRPSFTSYVAHELPTSSSAEFTPPYNQWLIITLRGILDSKYYEHLLCSEDVGRQPTRFPEFVYAWLGQYEVDEASRQVKDIEHRIEERGNKARVDLLMALEQEKVRKMWEIYTFREFLMEDLALDELGFYLHCRFLLFRGPQLSHSPGRYSMAHFVTLDRAMEVAAAVMYKLAAEELDEFKNLLKSKGKEKQRVPHVESSLVLRLMLEYYRREKRCKFLAVQQMFAMCPDKVDSFQYFKTICKNMNAETSDLQLARMYRDVYVIGQGSITPEAFFTFANETPYLFNCLRLKGVWGPPPLTLRGDINKAAGRYGEMMHSVHMDWRENGAIEDIKSLVNSMGIPDVSDQILVLENVIRRLGQVENLRFNGRNMADIYKHLWALIANLQLSFEEHNAFNKVNNSGSATTAAKRLARELQSVRQSSSILANRVQAQKIDEMIAKNAIIRIQRKWKERVSKKMGVMLNVVKGVAAFKRNLSKKFK